MSVQPPRKGWNIIGGIFMGCGGLLFVGLGGMCSVLIFGDGFKPQTWPMLLLSLGLLAGGAALIYQAIKLFRE